MCLSLPDGSERPDRHPRIALATAISVRIIEVHENAARATVDAAAAHAVATAASEDETSLAECVRRNDELGESTTLSEALKTVALEHEAVVVDALLARMLEPGAVIAAITQTELHCPRLRLPAPHAGGAQRALRGRRGGHGHCSPLLLAWRWRRVPRSKPRSWRLVRF